MNRRIRAEEALTRNDDPQRSGGITGDGETTEECNRLTVMQAWNGLGNRVSEHITKGREVVVQGRLAIDHYTDKDGRDVTKPVINLISFHLCGRKSTTSELVSEKRARKTKVG